MKTFFEISRTVIFSLFFGRRISKVHFGLFLFVNPCIFLPAIWPLLKLNAKRKFAKVVRLTRGKEEELQIRSNSEKSNSFHLFQFQYSLHINRLFSALA